jgi:hypothetical protein
MLDPKTHHFTCYVTYVPGSDEPELIVYPTTTEINSDELFRLAESDALEGTLSITKTVTANALMSHLNDIGYHPKMSGRDSVALQAALEYLYKTRSKLLGEFIRSCWDLAEGQFNRKFPATFPRLDRAVV